MQATILTQRGNFLTRDEYCQLVYAAVQGLPRFQSDPSAVIPLLPPAVLKPKALWTGKQVISSLLLALTGDLTAPACYMNLDSTAKVSARMWGESGSMPGDHLIVIRDNELLVGVVDKNSIGSSEFGLTHSVYELYGAQRAGSLLTAIGRLLTIYLQVSLPRCVLLVFVCAPYLCFPCR
jgi:DNA-directed RNA polymerase I subunit RPA1